MSVSEWNWKTRKIMVPCPIPAICESLMSVKENIDRKRKKRKKKERKNNV